MALAARNYSGPNLLGAAHALDPRMRRA